MHGCGFCCQAVSCACGASIFFEIQFTTPVTENLVISPADGRVLSTGIVDVPNGLDLPDGAWRRNLYFHECV